jgi:hypothetical protein
MGSTIACSEAGLPPLPRARLPSLEGPAPVELGSQEYPSWNTSTETCTMRNSSRTHPPDGLVAATYSHGEDALQCLPHSKKTTASGCEQAGVMGGGNSCSPRSMTLAGQSLTLKTNDLSIRPQGLLLPCGSHSRRQAKVLGRRASLTRRRSIRNWRLGADRGLAANFRRHRPDLSRDRWTRSPEC